MFKNLFLLLFFWNCKSPSTGDKMAVEYKLNKPSKIWKMPKKIVEISGISVLKFPIILSINDEDGKLFEYNLETEKLEDSYKFSKDGDYEDIAIHGDTVYVLRSDGTIFKINDYKKSPKVEKYNTFLNKKQDTEGLYFDAAKNRLLIACKEEVKIDKEDYNVIYEFDLNTNTLQETPAFTILKKHFKFKKKKHHFAPSSLAINPITNTLFIISTVGKLMVEMSLDGEILNKYSLNYSHFKQPEGIFFAENGDLYISNEGKKGKGNILKFENID